MKHDRKYIINLRQHTAGELKKGDINKIIIGMNKEYENQIQWRRIMKITKITLVIVIIFILLLAMYPKGW